MANIESVKLPDGTEYDVKDNISGYAHKIAPPTTDNLIVQTASGDIADSGIAKSVIPNEIATRNVVGAKNLLPYPYANTSFSYNGLTFTDNGDGTVTISGVSIDEAYFMFRTAEQKFKLEANKVYIASMENASSATSMFVTKYIGTTYIEALAIVTGAEVSFTPTYDNYDRLGCGIYIPSGTDLSVPVTLKPMLRLATDTDNTYEPYAQTNRQLTVGKVNTDAIAPTEDGTTASKAYVVGEPFFRGGDYCVCISAIASGGSFTLNTNYKVKPLGSTVHEWVDVTSQCTFDASPTYVRKKVLDDGHTYKIGLTMTAGADTAYASLIVLPKKARCYCSEQATTPYMTTEYIQVWIEDGATNVGTVLRTAVTSGEMSINLDIPHEI